MVNMDKSDMRDLVDALVPLLRRETIFSYDISSSHPLAVWLELHYRDRGALTGHSASQVAAWVIFEAASRDVKRNHDHKVQRPLAAARYMLAMHAPYPDEETIIEELGISIAMARGKRLRRAADPVQSITLRLILATRAGGYGDPGSDGSWLGKEGARTIAFELAESVKEVLRTPDWHRIQQRGRAIAQTIERYSQHKRLILTSDRAALVQELERCASYYPLHLSTSNLAPTLALYEFNRPSSDSATRRPVLIPTEAKRVVLLGGPGMGKTTVLKAALIEQLRAGGGGALLYLPDLPAEFLKASFSVGDLSAGIASAAFAPPDTLNPEPLAAEVRDAFERSDANFLLALDGLDEMPDHLLAPAVCLLESLDRRFHGKIWVSSRFSGYDQPFQAEEFEVAGILDPELLTGAWWRAEPERGRASKYLADSKVADELLVHPIVAGLIHSQLNASSPFSTDTEVYAAFVDAVIKRVWKSRQRRKPVKLERIRAALEELAWAMAEPRGARDERRGWNYTVRLNDALNMLRPELRQELDAIVEDDGLLQPKRSLGNLPAERADYEWVHSCFYEYLVGAYLAGLVRRGHQINDDLFEQLISHGEWQESLRHSFAMLGSEHLEDLASKTLAGLDKGEGSDTQDSRIFRMGASHVWRHVGDAEPTKAAIAEWFAARGFDAEAIGISVALTTAWVLSRPADEPAHFYVIATCVRASTEHRFELVNRLEQVLLHDPSSRTKWVVDSLIGADPGRYQALKVKIGDGYLEDE